MEEKLRNLPVLFVTFLFSSAALLAADTSQNVNIQNDVKIPGASLKAGAYAFSVEDRLADRAIVRITNPQDTNEHYLLLAVPNPKLSSGASGSVTFFRAGSDHGQALKAWSCSDCTAPLEFVYPKLEAVKITDDSTEPVLAVDPSYDKLPSDLSADDMKVVTLWLLSPERISADNVGQGVKAAKYSADENPAPAPVATSAAPAAPPATAAPPAPAAPSVQAPVETASTNATATADTEPAAPAHRRHLPKTASNTYLFGLCGFICLLLGVVLRIRRLRIA